jgi:glycosyltransferase involved in cell wall biosynthesis
MTHPLFSVVIPIRQRHDTLVYAMKSILEQPFSDLELIVMDNFSSPETVEVVESFNDPRIRYHRSPERLSMSENWELGLSHTTGEYVTILGDDDAFISGSFDLCEKLLEMYDFKIVSWNCNLYTWPNFISPWRRDRLYIELDQAPSIWDSRLVLKKVYQGEFHYTCLPMLYNSFVHKSIIERVKSHFGRYFLSYCPDVYSGIVNAYFSDQYFYAVRSFSLTGASHHSTGSSFVYGGVIEEPAKKFIKEVKEEDFSKIHEQLIPSNNLEVAIANVLLHTKGLFFPEDPTMELNIFNHLQLMAEQINRNYLSYDSTLAEINTLAAKHNISLSELNVPNKLMEEDFPTPKQGLVDRASGFVGLIINCTQASITNVLQASKLVQAMLPSNDIFLDICRQVIQIDESKNIEKDLDLQEINLIVFPDLTCSWKKIALELSSIIRDIITHPLSSHITLLLYIGDSSDLQMIDELISEITLKLLLDQDLQIYEDREPAISSMQGLSESEWLKVLPSLYGRLPLKHENQEIINQIGVYSQKGGIPNIRTLDHLTSLVRYKSIEPISYHLPLK